MTKINIFDKSFVPFISAQEIDTRIQIMADALNEQLKDKNPVFLGILNGCFVFASDLFKKIQVPAEITFIKLASYEGTTSTGKVLTSIGMDKNLSGRHVVLVEDIIDTGKTLSEFIPQLHQQQIASLTIVSLLTKPDARQYDIKPDYIGFEIENKFVVGYGLDYDGYGRNLPEIYQLHMDAK